jgi:hypothetical protein
VIVDLSVDPQTLTSTATYDVDPNVDLARGPIFHREPRRSDWVEVEVEGRVRRLRTAALQSTSTLGVKVDAQVYAHVVDLQRIIRRWGQGQRLDTFRSTPTPDL